MLLGRTLHEVCFYRQSFDTTPIRLELKKIYFSMFFKCFLNVTALAFSLWATWHETDPIKLYVTQHCCYAIFQFVSYICTSVNTCKSCETRKGVPGALAKGPVDKLNLWSRKVWIGLDFDEIGGNSVREDIGKWNKAGYFTTFSFKLKPKLLPF